MGGSVDGGVGRWSENMGSRSQREILLPTAMTNFELNLSQSKNEPIREEVTHGIDRVSMDGVNDCRTDMGNPSKVPNITPHAIRE